MDIGIGLPNAVSGTTRRQLLDWARAAEQAGFSSLGTIDRIVYPNYEPLVALAAAAAVTERIRLATTVMLGPLRINAAVVAKQMLLLGAVAGGGRTVLGIGLGGREDDYEVSGVSLSGRGAWQDRALAQIRRVFAAERNAARYLRDYYAFLGEELSAMIAGSAARDPSTVRAYVSAFERAGCDELIMFPSSSDPEQVNLLAEAVRR